MGGTIKGLSLSVEVQEQLLRPTIQGWSQTRFLSLIFHILIILLLAFQASRRGTKADKTYISIYGETTTCL